MSQPIDLDAIIEAGKRATPRPYAVSRCENKIGKYGTVLLGEQQPNGISTVIADMVPGRKGANAEYLALAANSADHLAARVKQLEAERERVKEKLELYKRCANECRVAAQTGKHEIGVAIMNARSELYDIIVRELAKLIGGGE